MSPVSAALPPFAADVGVFASARLSLRAEFADTLQKTLNFAALAFSTRTIKVNPMRGSEE
jgi:hypothetical protein